MKRQINIFEKIKANILSNRESKTENEENQAHH